MITLLSKTTRQRVRRPPREEQKRVNIGQKKLKTSPYVRFCQSAHERRPDAKLAAYGCPAQTAESYCSTLTLSIELQNINAFRQIIDRKGVTRTRAVAACSETDSRLLGPFLGEHATSPSECHEVQKGKAPHVHKSENPQGMHQKIDRQGEPLCRIKATQPS